MTFNVDARLEVSSTLDALSRLSVQSEAITKDLSSIVRDNDNYLSQTHVGQNRAFDEVNIALALRHSMKSAHPPLTCKITPVIYLVISVALISYETDVYE